MSILIEWRLISRLILVSIDFSACSAKGLACAKAIAQEFGSKLMLVHSVDLHYYSTNPEYLLYDFPPLLAATEKAARDQMSEIVLAGGHQER